MAKLSDVPTPAMAGAALVGGVGLAYVVSLIFPGAAMWILLGGIFLVACLVALYVLLLKWLKARKARPLERGIMGQASMAPEGVSAPASRARLDDLRKTFEGGFSKLKAARKDWHNLPWYVIVGESGSGKTEAIRHCSVGFPPGLQDEYQGVGGTINMNWWFTNQAIILDTAGRIMFEEVAPGAASEWREFLRLLRIARPNCPINGMFLVIPADSLIKDTADVIERKAGKIVHQLDLIQRELDVRFPVFIVVTKCDLVNGFREFFDTIRDPQLQHQILGWSNPAPLDQPFSAESLEQHFTGLVGRLNRRRMGLLLDPVNTEDPSKRRSDQVDSLYSFPQSMQHLIPRLKKYLEMVFVASEWSSKPLFLRGIYFTSAMREGAALDADLAEALGVPVDSLPEGRVWERERAYFLRDVLASKAFKERGLVTRAGNAGRQHRRRKVVVLTAGFISVAVLALMTWLGTRSLRESIGVHHDYWQAAYQADWDARKRFWQPIVAPEYEGGPYNQYLGTSYLSRPKGAAGAEGAPARPAQRETVQINGKAVTLAEFHRDLFDLSRRKIEIPWIFSLAKLGKDIDLTRRQAATVVFEYGVVRPAVEAGRFDMILTRQGETALGSAPATAPAAGGAASAPASAPASPQEAQDWSPRGAGTAALAALIRLEAQAQAPGKIPPDTSLDPLMHYVLPADAYATYSQNHKEMLDRILRETFAGESAWPPAGVLGLRTPQEYKALSIGVDNFIRYGTGGGRQSEVLAGIDKLRLALVAFAQIEDTLQRLPDDFQAKWTKGAAETISEYQWAATEWKSRLAAVQAAGTAVEAARNAIPNPAKRPLGELYKDQAARKAQDVIDAYKLLMDATGLNQPSAASQPADATAPQPGTPAAVYATLKNARDEQIARIQRSDSEALADLQRLEQEYLAVAGASGLDAYVARLRMYGRANEPIAQLAAPAPRAASGSVREFMDSLSRLRGALGQIDASIRDIRQGLAQQAVSMPGARSQKAEAACRFVLQVAGARRTYDALGNVLSSAPDSGPAWAQVIADQVKAQALPAIPRPEIPMAAGPKEDKFQDSYHPAALGGVVAAWKAMGDLLVSSPATTQGQESGVLNRPELAGRYKDGQAAMDAYLASYVDYWCKLVGGKTAPGSLKVTGTDWKTFNAALKTTSFEQINIGLEKLGNTVQAALAPTKGVVSGELAARVADTSEMIGSSLGNLKLETYQVACDKVCGNWQGLSEDVTRGRLTLVPGKPADYAGPALMDSGYVGRYWKELCKTGLELLASGFQDKAAQALMSLKKDYAEFPLVAPPRVVPANPPSLTPQKLDEARKLLAVVSSQTETRSGVEAGVTIGQGAETRDPEINYQLRRLRRPSLSDEDQDWVQRVQAVADALPSGSDTCKCVVTIPKQKDDSFTNWLLHVYLKQGNAVVGKDRTAQEDGKLGEAAYPGDSLTIEFYRFPDDKTPTRTVVVEGSWAAVRLLHEGQVARKLPDGTETTYRWEPKERSREGKTWKVAVIVKDDTGAEKSFWVQLEFEKALPESSKWAPGVAR